MKEIKGRFLKKLKSIPKVGVLKTDRILNINAPDLLLDLFRPNSCQPTQKPPIQALPPPESEKIDIAQLLRELGEEEDELTSESPSDKENIRPDGAIHEKTQLTEKPKLVSCPFRPSDQNSGSLFDPDLLAAFKQLGMDHQKTQESKNRSTYEAEFSIDDNPPDDQLSEFEERCPPGGTYSVILYITTIRGIRKTFEDCYNVRFLLGSLRVLYHERDVSMHLEYREELWKILGGRVVPPRLFIKGKYIGGADEVLGLHEQGRLRPLLEDIPIDRFNGMCDECGGARFVMCTECCGSRKLATGEHESFVRCSNCNENGLVICSLCC